MAGIAWETLPKCRAEACPVKMENCQDSVQDAANKVRPCRPAGWFLLSSRFDGNGNY